MAEPRPGTNCDPSSRRRASCASASYRSASTSPAPARSSCASRHRRSIRPISARLIDRAIASTFRTEGPADNPVLVADMPADRLPAVKLRIGLSLAVGNEGAGTVVKAGADVQHLLGCGMYATYRKLPAAAATPLPEGASAADGASVFVNPRTALGFVETMRTEGHSAIIHTAAASNLGQMLVRQIAVAKHASH